MKSIDVHSVSNPSFAASKVVDPHLDSSIVKKLLVAQFPVQRPLVNAADKHSQEKEFTHNNIKYTVPTIFGNRYVINSFLDAGGFGIVFDAKDEKHLKPVVIKIVSLHMMTFCQRQVSVT